MNRRYPQFNRLGDEIERLEAELDLCVRRSGLRDRARLETLLAEFMQLKERASAVLEPLRVPQPTDGNESRADSNGDCRTVLLTEHLSAVFQHEPWGWRFESWKRTGELPFCETFLTMPSSDDLTRCFDTLEAAVTYFRVAYLSPPLVGSD